MDEIPVAMLCIQPRHGVSDNLDSGLVALAHIVEKAVLKADPEGHADTERQQQAGGENGEEQLAGDARRPEQVHGVVVSGARSPFQPPPSALISSTLAE